jgi:hypothetical protein
MEKLQLGLLLLSTRLIELSTNKSYFVAKAIIDDLVKRGVVYAVGLYPFLHSVSEWRSSNVEETLRPASEQMKPRGSTQS